MQLKCIQEDSAQKEEGVQDEVITQKKEYNRQLINKESDRIKHDRRMTTQHSIDRRTTKKLHAD
jgi:hypothetical protein